MSTFYFPLDGEAYRERRRWSSAAQRLSRVTTAEGAAKRHALQHGVAGIWNADDSLVVYTRKPNGTLSRKTHRKACPREFPAPFSAKPVPPSCDLHVYALGQGYTMVRLHTTEGRAHVEGLAKSKHGFSGDTYTAESAEVVSIASSASDAGLRVRFN
ncbi:hypothetical protein [Azospirillum rugosum]|uniref:Uncharacterized protein n=1 Tax=Azospirillum rugosum TaxID=416170 RepID=A0ABS4SEM2_9PROT|nr:hypothetical protein [Azospirillum rugosum]MBP2291032.1 hypothetical protein [Azospirillum rugosum]MDQ0524904.1 hypothetical protein [Azospirillum rugosum]